MLDQEHAANQRLRVIHEAYHDSFTTFGHKRRTTKGTLLSNINVTVGDANVFIIVINLVHLKSNPTCLSVRYRKGRKPHRQCDGGSRRDNQAKQMIQNKVIEPTCGLSPDTPPPVPVRNITREF